MQLVAGLFFSLESPPTSLQDACMVSLDWFPGFAACNGRTFSATGSNARPGPFLRQNRPGWLRGSLSLLDCHLRCLHCRIIRTVLAPSYSAVRSAKRDSRTGGCCAFSACHWAQAASRCPGSVVIAFPSRRRHHRAQLPNTCVLFFFFFPPAGALLYSPPGSPWQVMKGKGIDWLSRQVAGDDRRSGRPASPSLLPPNLRPLPLSRSGS